MESSRGRSISIITELSLVFNRRFSPEKLAPWYSKFSFSKYLYPLSSKCFMARSKNSTEDNLILRLDQATKHLYTQTAQQQLQQSISQFLSRDVNVTINIVEQTVADPYQIQSHINNKRYDYAKEVLENDNVVQGLVQSFQATLDEESVSAL